MSEAKSKAKMATTSTVPAGEATPIAKGSHVYLVDGSGYIFRAFHALPPLTRPSDGLPVGAVHGFCAMLWKLLRETKAAEAPTHFAVIFDASEKTFRKEIYEDYKAHRPPPPEELVPQFALIRDAVKAFNVACIEQNGFEADDLIASYAREIVDAGGDVTIVSSDKDLMQLVRPGVVMLDAMKGKKIGRDEVIEKFGVPPEKVVDVQSLAGDSTDNVPGVPGIGVKTAAELIKEYGDLDALLARAGEIKQPKRREKLIEFADQARVSRELVRLKDDVPDMIPAEALGVRDPDPPDLLGFLRVMEFNTLTRRIAEGLGAEPPAPVDVSVGATVPTKGRAAPGVEKAQSEPVVSESPAAGAAEAAAAAKAPFDRSKYETVVTRDHLEAWIMKAYAAGRVAFDTETTSIDPMVAELVGFSMAIAPGEACYVPLSHRASSESFDFGSHDGIVQVPIAEALALLKPLLEEPSILKIGQNIKYDLNVLAQHGIKVAPIDDTMLMSYALDAGKGGHGMDDLAMRHLGHACMTFDQLMAHVPGKKKSERTFGQAPLDKATEYAAEDADVTLRLWMVLKPRLAAERVTTVYETLERPLIPVIAEMERGRHPRRRCDPFAAVIHVRAGRRAARGGGQSPRRPQVQPRLAAPARRTAVRPPAASRRQAYQERPVGDTRRPARRPRRQRGAARRRAAPDQHHARVAAVDQAALDLHRRAAGLCARRHGTHPYLLCTGRHHHGPPRFVGAEPAEHPHPHQGGPRDPYGLRRRAGQEADLRRLQSDRAARAGAHGRYPTAT